MLTAVVIGLENGELVDGQSGHHQQIVDVDLLVLSRYVLRNSNADAAGEVHEYEWNHRLPQVVLQVENLTLLAFHRLSQTLNVEAACFYLHGLCITIRIYAKPLDHYTLQTEVFLDRRHRLGHIKNVEGHEHEDKVLNDATLGADYALQRIVGHADSVLALLL